MKKIFSITLLIVLSMIMGNGAPNAGINTVKADTPVGNIDCACIGSCCGCGEASDAGCNG